MQYATFKPNIGRWPALNTFCRWAHFHQEYKVFAPRPSTYDLALTFPAILKNGRRIDVLKASYGKIYEPYSEIDHPCSVEDSVCLVTYDMDYRFEPLGMNDRWLKYFENLIEGWGHLDGHAKKHKRESQEQLRLAFGQYICRTWNAYHKNRATELKKFNMTLYLRPIHKVLEVQPYKKITFWYHNC